MTRDYQKEYRDFGGTEEQKKRRAQRNKARRQAIADGKVSKGDGKEIDHVSKNRKGPLGTKTQVLTKKANRSKQPKRDGSDD